MWSFLLFLFTFILSFCVEVPAQQKSEPELFNQAPFEEWLKQGPVKQIPWKFEMSDEGLSLHQRLVAHIEITVSGKELAHRGNKGALLAFVQMSDSNGNVFRDARRTEMGELKSDKHSNDLTVYWNVFVLPGDYKVVLAIYHTGTAEHSLAQHTLHIDHLKDDPLPEAWRDLPPVEFLLPVELPDRDVFFRPEIKGKLSLPVANRRPLHVELLADVTASELFRGSFSRYARHMEVAIPTLKALSQLQLQNGSLEVATLDLMSHKAVFEQQAVQELDWTALKKTLPATDPGMVDVSHLSKKTPKPDFLRQELARRIREYPQGSPMQVFIVISSPLFLYSFHNLEAEALPENCNCRLFFIEYDSSRHNTAFSATGDVEKMLKPISVRSFAVHSPEQVRKAIAKIIAEFDGYPLSATRPLSSMDHLLAGAVTNCFHFR